MSKQIRVISDADWEVLKRIVSANQNLQQSSQRPLTNNQFRDGDDSMSPEVYIALPPDSGIPGLDSAASGSGSDNPPTEGDRPGSAICSIYRIINGELRPIPGLTKRVYNLSETAIESDWITVHREKTGIWLASVGGGSSSSVEIVRFRIKDFDNPPEFASENNPCSATAYVLSRPPGVSQVTGEIDGMIIVQDRTGCKLNAPYEDLLDQAGYAVYLTADVDPTTGIVDGPCPGMPTSGWEIIDICCKQDRCDQL